MEWQEAGRCRWQLLPQAPLEIRIVAGGAGWYKAPAVGRYQVRCGSSPVGWIRATVGTLEEAKAIAELLAAQESEES